jgi:hypothetical protein
MAQDAGAKGTRPRVVFDLKMPRYEYRHGEDKSMSVDRSRARAKVTLPSDYLANLNV